MLSYTFSTREKIMLVVFGVALLAIAWYQFVFVNIQNQIISVESQISATEDQLQAFQTRAANLDKMREIVEKYKEQGVEPTLLPQYDNTQSLMAYLHSVLSAAQSYDMSFDNPGLSKDDGTVHRSGTIRFNVGSYEDARKMVESIAHGPYPCQVDALSIGSKKSRRSNEAVAFTANVQLTFFENPPEGSDVAAEEKSSGGQDMSVMLDWDK